jgi:hypothetical protein
VRVIIIAQVMGILIPYLKDDGIFVHRSSAASSN